MVEELGLSGRKSRVYIRILACCFRHVESGCACLWLINNTGSAARAPAAVLRGDALEHDVCCLARHGAAAARIVLHDNRMDYIARADEDEVDVIRSITKGTEHTRRIMMWFCHPAMPRCHISSCGRSLPLHLHAAALQEAQPRLSVDRRALLRRAQQRRRLALHHICIRGDAVGSQCLIVQTAVAKDSEEHLISMSQ